jgi:hypothetical protein
MSQEKNKYGVGLWKTFGVVASAADSRGRLSHMDHLSTLVVLRGETK